MREWVLQNAEMWVRDWIETWDLRVHLLDRTEGGKTAFPQNPGY